MYSSKVTLVILAALCCSTKVCFGYPDVSSKNMKIQRQIVGRYEVDRENLAYSVCEFLNNYHIAKCSVIFETNAFDHSARSYTCDWEIHSQYEEGRLDILGVTIWDSAKVLFAWRDLDPEAGLGDLYIEDVTMDGCRALEQTISIYLRPDEKSLERIIPFENTYDVTFFNKEKCGNGVCKVTINERGDSSVPVMWFSGSHLIHALEPIEGCIRKLLIIRTNGQEGEAKLYLLGGGGKQFLTSYDYSSEVGWSGSQNIISFCYTNRCLRFTNRGDLQADFTWIGESSVPPSAYEALFNLPNGEFAALVCHRVRNSVYRIIKVGINGSENLNFKLNELKCNNKPFYMNSKFYMKNNREFCLSIFHNQPASWVDYKFSTYCFPL